MRAENSAHASFSKSDGMPAHGHLNPGKILNVSLEPARFDTAVVLHYQDRGISRSEGRALAGLISEVLPSARRMVIDLAAVHSLDSGALGELVMTHLWAEAAGYALSFASPRDSVRGLFESTNLVSILDVYSSVEDAISAMHHERVQSA